MHHSHEVYIAQLAENSTNTTFLCGHCQSTLSAKRVFANEGDDRYDLPCRTIGLCSADDCGAVNCCDEAMRAAEQQQEESCVAL